MLLIGRRILELRRARGWSQKRLAQHIGLSRVAVSQWENGQTLPGKNRIIEIAKLFNVEPSWLAFGHETDEIAELIRRMTPRQREAWIELGKAMVSEKI